MKRSISIGTSVRWCPAPNDDPVRIRCWTSSMGSMLRRVPAGLMPMTTAIPPRWVDRSACSMVRCVPTTSNAKSTPPPPAIACTRATGSSRDASTTWLAPNSCAHSGFFGSTSPAHVLAADAVPALPARGDVARAHVVAGLDGLHGGADLLDHAGRLVAEHDGERVGIVAGDHVQVTVTDPVGHPTDEHLVGPGLQHLHVL